MIEKTKGEYLESDINTAAHLQWCGYQNLGLKETADGTNAFCIDDHDGLAGVFAILYKNTVQNLSNKLQSAQKRKPS